MSYLAGHFAPHFYEEVKVVSNFIQSNRPRARKKNVSNGSVQVYAHKCSDGVGGGPVGATGLTKGELAVELNQLAVKEYPLSKPSIKLDGESTLDPIAKNALDELYVFVRDAVRNTIQAGIDKTIPFVAEILNEDVKALKRHPYIQKIKVVGYTDEDWLFLAYVKYCTTLNKEPLVISVVPGTKKEIKVYDPEQKKDVKMDIFAIESGSVSIGYVTRECIASLYGKSGNRGKSLVTSEYFTYTVEGVLVYYERGKINETGGSNKEIENRSNLSFPDKIENAARYLINRTCEIQNARTNVIESYTYQGIFNAFDIRNIDYKLQLINSYGEALDDSKKNVTRMNNILSTSKGFEIYTMESFGTPQCAWAPGGFEPYISDISKAKLTDYLNNNLDFRRVYKYKVSASIGDIATIGTFYVYMSKLNIKEPYLLVVNMDYRRIQIIDICKLSLYLDYYLPSQFVSYYNRLVDKTIAEQEFKNRLHGLSIIDKLGINLNQYLPMTPVGITDTKEMDTVLNYLMKNYPLAYHSNFDMDPLTEWMDYTAESYNMVENGEIWDLQKLLYSKDGNSEYLYVIVLMHPSINIGVNFSGIKEHWAFPVDVLILTKEAVDKNERLMDYNYCKLTSYLTTVDYFDLKSTGDISRLSNLVLGRDYKHIVSHVCFYNSSVALEARAFWNKEQVGELLNVEVAPVFVQQLN